MEYISWFLENFTSESISMVQLGLTLGLACVISVYIFFLYRMLSRKTFYSKRYNITVASMAVITTAIIFTVQSDVVLSLGMVGALSIVRFRTAIKDALDLVFLFWSICVGICCGAHMSEIAIILSAMLTLLILCLDKVSMKRGYSILILEIRKQESEKEILEKIKEFSSHCKVKARNAKENNYKFVVEVKAKQEYQLVQGLKENSQIQTISLIAQEGETTY